MQSLVQRGVARLYERYGARIVWFGLGGALGLAILTALAWIPVGSRFYGASAGEALLLVALAAAAVVLIFVIVVVSCRREIGEMLAWSRAPADQDSARAAWIAVTAHPIKLATRAAVITMVAMWVSGFTITRPILDLPVWFLLIGHTFGMFGPAGWWVLTVFAMELLNRPMLEDIARYLPDDFEPPRRNLSLTAKALAPLPIVTMFAALAVGAWADVSSDRETRGLVVLAIASAVVGVACVIYVIVTRTVLTPLESLTAATQRVRAGDLDAAVPVVTADDLGTLTASFNQMLSGLREREALQTRNERLASELRDSLARLAAASDEARRQVERDLHDGAQQRLVLLKLKLAMLERDPSNEELLAELRGDLDAALAELRDLAHGIYPAVLESDGLHAALADGAARASISTRVECDGVGRYPREVEAAVYFCCLEALQNAAKHAGEGATAAVRLRGRAGELRFEVTDDGRGCDVGAALRSGGMQNMSDRVGALGGTLRIESEPGKGTTVTGTIPVGAGST